MASGKRISGLAVCNAFLACGVLWCGSGLAGEDLARQARTIAFEIDPGVSLVGDSVDLSEKDRQQISCLAQNAYHEARDQGEVGMAAVSEVVMNRVKDPAYPGSVCQVVQQCDPMRGVCQFSWVNDGRDHTMLDQASVKLAYKVAVDQWKAHPYHYKPKWRELTGGATRYKNGSISKAKWPNWRQTVEIGMHQFFAPKGPQS